MIILKSILDVKEHLGSQSSLGFVPTMGALHDGHLSLIQKSQSNNDKTIVSIYINSTQFNNADDFKNYPNTIEQDISSLEKLKVDYLFLPDYETLYPDGYRYQVKELSFSKQLCGSDRPGHFEGVLTVVLKLLNLIKPTNAYFGKKDYQQYKLIKDMTEAFFLDTKIVAVQTMREHDGLAMSSRNLNLDESSRAKAPLIYQNLKSKSSLKEIEKKLTMEGFKVHYLVEKNMRRFIAASINNVRLIDNVKL